MTARATFQAPASHRALATRVALVAGSAALAAFALLTGADVGAETGSRFLDDVVRIQLTAWVFALSLATLVVALVGVRLEVKPSASGRRVWLSGWLALLALGFIARGEYADATVVADAEDSFGFIAGIVGAGLAGLAIAYFLSGRCQSALERRRNQPRRRALATISTVAVISGWTWLVLFAALAAFCVQGFASGYAD